ncbi:hypothetical protein ACIRU2_20120 [Streptomyces sp. NPDC101169]|uniref:hypothetical protein n=1 Tax=Streptomyces sp. NPDC101169 TaxID=3366121 RepID=UPI0037F135F5
MPSSHLLIIGDRAALSWVVTEQRMAFPAGRSKAARALEEDDEIFLYTTRGCFRNPTRDLGRVVGRASVAGPVRVLEEPVVFGERSFTEGCRLEVSGLTRFREGLVLRDLVPRLSVFPDPATWSVRMRRASLTLPPRDAELLRTELEPAPVVVRGGGRGLPLGAGDWLRRPTSRGIAALCGVRACACAT